MIITYNNTLWKFIIFAQSILKSFHLPKKKMISLIIFKSMENVYRETQYHSLKR